MENLTAEQVKQLITTAEHTGMPSVERQQAIHQLIKNGLLDSNTDMYTQKFEQDYPEVYQWFVEVYC